jgi:hypothetical protein
MLNHTEPRHFRAFVFAGLTAAVSFVVAALAHAAQHVQAFI